MIINHNISAINAHRQLGVNQNGVQGSLEKLSSGMQINRAGDDAAGLAISEKMRGQIRGLEQASTNAQDGISLIQTTEGALNETHDILQRMRELAVQSSNDTNTAEDREEIQKEINQLSQEITRISENTQYNTQDLLTGGFEATFHIGANAGQNINISVDAMSAEALGVAGHELSATTVDDKFQVTNTNGDPINIVIVAPTDGDQSFSSTLNEDGDTLTISLATNNEQTPAVTSTNADVLAAINAQTGLSATLAEGVNGDTVATGASSTSVAVSTETDAIDLTKGINVSTRQAADSAIDTLDNAINLVSAERSKLGAVQNRLEHTINNLGTSAENLTAAESRIRDTDMAKEMMEFTKNNILSQAAQSMLAQANQVPQGVLQLLQ